MEGWPRCPSRASKGGGPTYQATSQKRMGKRLKGADAFARATNPPPTVMQTRHNVASSLHPHTYIPPTIPAHPSPLTRRIACSDTRFALVYITVLSTPPSVVLSASRVNTRALSA